MLNQVTVDEPYENVFYVEINENEENNEDESQINAELHENSNNVMNDHEDQRNDHEVCESIIPIICLFIMPTNITFTNIIFYFASQVKFLSNFILIFNF